MDPTSLNRVTRRTFVRSIAYAGAVMPAWTPRLLRADSPNGKVNIAGVGVQGKGAGDIAETSKGHNVVALCDVDEIHLAIAKEKYPAARTYTDWRRMLEDSKDIDGVTISTPDHMHAPVTMSAMLLGKHVYTQKPLTKDVHEARQLADYARAHPNLVTQMGNQGHSSIGYRMLVQLIQQGAIGKIKEAHAWSNRPIWPQGIERPAGNDAPPATLHWDLWLGTAPARPYVGPGELAAKDRKNRIKGPYHPFNWRGYLDFGAGAQGDMACHIMDPVVWSMNLGAPHWLTSQGPAPTAGETFPKWSIIQYEFPGTIHTAGPSIRVTWYDGGKKPDEALAPMKPGQKLPDNGSLYIGDKGVILCPHGAGPQLLPDAQYADFKRPELEARDHYMTWTNAIRGQDKTTSHFLYAGPLTETVLLGNIALRFPNEKLEWDSAGLKVKNLSKANDHLRRDYRKGWEVANLS
jgi:predicted dehydrogenase